MFAADQAITDALSARCTEYAPLVLARAVVFSAYNKVGASFWTPGRHHHRSFWAKNDDHAVDTLIEKAKSWRTEVDG